MHRKGRGETGEGQGILAHIFAFAALAAMALVWTWPLALNVRGHIPGVPGDNYSFLWNLWWMRKALAAPGLEFFQSKYLFNPFGVDLINHPHTALQGYLSATLLSGLSIIEAENVYILLSVFLNAACAYALAFDLVRHRRLALFAGIAFGGSPYVAAHLLGHFDLLTAWVIPLFALLLRRALHNGRWPAAVGAGLCAAIAAYSAYYHVVYLAVFAVTYTLSSFRLVRTQFEERSASRALFTIRLVLIALMTLAAVVVVVIALSGGGRLTVAGVALSATRVQNPLLVIWVLCAVWMLTKWRMVVRVQRAEGDVFWRGMQTLSIAGATFAVVCLPLIVQAFRLAVSGRYVSQVYFWRSAPRGTDALAAIAGNPFHPVYGDSVSALYQKIGIDRIEAVGWVGLVPAIVLLIGRGHWLDREEVRRWKAVLIVFAVWALGPFFTVAGFDTGLPLPQALARFIPLVENARMPGRAMVCVYLALGVLMTQRLAALKGPALFSRPAVQWALLALLALDYLPAPIPLTALSRPAVYEQLASIDDESAVIEVPFGIGDGLSAGRGSQERRLLWDATIHGHPVVGGYIGRMPPMVAQAYDSMPVLGNLLRLSHGEEPIDEPPASALPFRYLVLNTRAASAELIDYVRSTLDMDLITSADDLELYAVQGVKLSNATARR